MLINGRTSTGWKVLSGMHRVLVLALCCSTQLINDMDEEMEITLLRSADDAKLAGITKFGRPNSKLS